MIRSTNGMVRSLRHDRPVVERAAPTLIPDRLFAGHARIACHVRGGAARSFLMSSYPTSMFRLCGTLLLLLLCAAPSQIGHAQGQAPQIISLDPDRAGPGATLDVTIGGIGFIQGATVDFGT